MTKAKKSKYVVKYKETSPGVYKAINVCPPHVWHKDLTSEMDEWYCDFCGKDSFTAPDCIHCGLTEEGVVRKYPKNYDSKRQLVECHLNLSLSVVKKLAQKCKSKLELNSLLGTFLKEEFPEEFDSKKHLFSFRKIERFLSYDGHLFFYEYDFARGTIIDINKHTIELMERSKDFGDGCSFLDSFLRGKL
ncbi:MAG: hypothetical protein HY226_06265 [Candidatus Vogelbacteria bacterium]|nr:hypothetical protein [Candidatus Vogelbacteria bacterium]